jgi:hypothetical protein
MVFLGIGISLVSGAVVGVTVVGVTVVGGTVVGATVVVGCEATVVVVAAGTIWARPAEEPPRTDNIAAVMPRRRGRGVLVRT